MAMAKICPVFLKEKKIRELMAELNCSYKKALTFYVPPMPHLIDISQDPPLQTPRPVQHDTPIPMDDVTPENATNSYANITKETSSSPNKKSKAEKRRNKKQTMKDKENDVFECVSETSEVDIEIEEPPNERNRPEAMEQSSWQRLLNKLKQKLFEEQNHSWEDKIKGCVNIVFGEILSWLMKLIADKPCCNFIKQLWIATTHTSQ